MLRSTRQPAGSSSLGRAVRSPAAASSASRRVVARAARRAVRRGRPRPTGRDQSPLPLRATAHDRPRANLASDIATTPVLPRTTRAMPRPGDAQTGVSSGHGQSRSRRREQLCADREYIEISSLLAPDPLQGGRTLVRTLALHADLERRLALSDADVVAVDGCGMAGRWMKGSGRGSWADGDAETLLRRRLGRRTSVGSS